MAAGDIGRKLDVLPNTLSANLTVLANAGLVDVAARWPLDHLRRRL